MGGEGVLMIAVLVCLAVLIFIVILLARRRMGRGEIVQATVRRVDLDDSDESGAVAVRLTYAFPWQGHTLEIQQPPRRGILPPREGERREMRWDAGRRRLRGLPSGRSQAIPLLIYAFVFSALTVAAGVNVALRDSLNLVWIGFVFALAALSFALAVVWVPRRQCRIFHSQLESGILQPVQAEFLGCVRRTDIEGNSVNVPVYQCLWNGRVYRLEVGNGRRSYRPGETVTLYRDRRDGGVIEPPKKYRATGNTR